MKPQGIRNYGNNCYLNASIQALSSLDFLGKYLQNIKNLTQKYLPKKFKFYAALVTLLDYASGQLALSDAEVSENLFEILSSLPRFTGQTEISSSSNLFQKFTTYLSNLQKSSSFDNQQQDPHEFLMLLMEKLHDDYLSLAVLLKRKSRHTLEIFPVKLEMIPKFPFMYLMGNCIFCKNCQKSNKFATLMTNLLSIRTLELQAYLGRKSNHLHQLLENHLKPDDLHYAKCEKCQKSQTPFGQPSLYKLEAITRCPKIAIIHIDRCKIDNLSGNMYKDTSHIKFEDFLNLSYFQNLQPDENSSKIYFLKSVVVHLGGDINYGHYVTYKRFGYKISDGESDDDPSEEKFSLQERKIKNFGVWYEMDDSVVSKIENSVPWLVKNVEAYLLFYELI